MQPQALKINKTHKYKMKKVLFILAMVMLMGFSASAQSDGFIKSGDGGFIDRGTTPEPTIALPQEHGSTSDQGTPLGSGLLILATLGAGYVAARRKHAE